MPGKIQHKLYIQSVDCNYLKTSRNLLQKNPMSSNLAYAAITAILFQIIMDMIEHIRSSINWTEIEIDQEKETKKKEMKQTSCHYFSVSAIKFLFIGLKIS